MTDESTPPADLLADALSTLAATRGERDGETVADRRAAADRVAAVATDHPSVAAERAGAVCEAFVAAVEGEGGTVAQDTVPGRADDVAEVSRSLARAVGAVAGAVGPTEPVVDAVVTGLESEETQVVAAAAEAAAPLVETAPPEPVVAALSDAVATTGGEATVPLTDRLSTVVDDAPGVLAPHVDGLVGAATDRYVETTTLRVVASLAETAPDALTDHADRLADTAEQFLDQARVSQDGAAAEMTAPAAVALYALAERRPAALVDETPTVAGYAALDPDPERSARGVRALRSVARERPESVADPGVVASLADYLHDVGVVDERAVETSAAPAALETLASAARSRPEAVADHLGRVLDAARRTSADGDRHAAALTAAVATTHPTAVAGAAAAVGDLVARADDAAVVHDWLDTVETLAEADVEVAPASLVEGVAGAMRTHDDPAVQRDGLAVLAALDAVPADAAAGVVDAVLGALETVADPDRVAVDRLAAAARADPESLADRAGAVTAAVESHDVDATTGAAVLAAVAETSPRAVTGALDALAGALDDPGAAADALSALRAVAAEHPDAVVDHLPAAVGALRDAADDDASDRAVVALRTLVAGADSAGDARTHAESVARALGELPDTAAVLEDALAATPPETADARRFVLAVFEALVAAAPEADDVTGADAAAAHRTMATVRRWSERLREASADAVVETDAMMLRSDARERASALDAAARAEEDGDADEDRLVDWIASDADAGGVDYVSAETLAGGATMTLETAVETVAATAPDGDDDERARRTAAAETLAAVGARSPAELVAHLDAVVALLDDATATTDDPAATRRTALGAVAMQAVATGAPGAVAPYAERLVALLGERHDPEVRAAALGALAFVAHRRADAVVDHGDVVADAAATADGDEATVDAAVLRAFVAAARDDGAALRDHAGTLAATAASVDDPDTADRALFHLRRVASAHPGAVAAHLETVVGTMRDDESVAERAVQVVGFVGTQAPDAVMEHLPAVAELLGRVDPGSTAAKVAVLTLGSATGETPTSLVNAEGVDLAATVDAVAGVLAASETPAVADDALVVFAVVASRRPELVVPHLDAVVAARRRFDDDNVANRALGVLVGVATADPAGLGDHLETLLDWLVAADPDDDTSRQFLETGLRALTDVVRETPEALRPHLGGLLAAGDATEDTRELALGTAYVAVRGDLDTAADHLDRVVAMTERTTQEGTKFGAATVLGASYVGGVSRETARRVGRAIADAPDPAGIVQHLTRSLVPDADGATALVAMLEGVAAASDDPRVAAVAEVGVVRALSESADAATAGAVGDCLAELGSVTAPYARRERLVRD